MESGDISRIAREIIRNHNPNIRFMGCISSDEILQLPIGEVKKTNGRAEAMMMISVVNILPRRENPTRMGHWILCVVTNHKIIFMDSYGMHPGVYSPFIRAFIDTHSQKRRVSYLDTRLQDAKSYVCGAYILFFIYIIARFGLDLIKEHLSRVFSKTDYRGNDKKVLNFLYKNYNMPPCKTTFCRKGMSYQQCKIHFCW